MTMDDFPNSNLLNFTMWFVAILLIILFTLFTVIAFIQARDSNLIQARDSNLVKDFCESHGLDLSKSEFFDTEYTCERFDGEGYLVVRGVEIRDKEVYWVRGEEE